MDVFNCRFRKSQILCTGCALWDRWVESKSHYHMHSKWSQVQLGDFISSPLTVGSLWLVQRTCDEMRGRFRSSCDTRRSLAVSHEALEMKRLPGDRNMSTAVMACVRFACSLSSDQPLVFLLSEELKFMKVCDRHASSRDPGVKGWNVGVHLSWNSVPFSRSLLKWLIRSDRWMQFIVYSTS